MVVPIWLSPLAPEECARLAILYLANDAPAGQSNPGLQHAYHKEIFDVLAALELKTTATNELSSLLEQPKDYNYLFSLYNRAPFRNSEIFVSALAEYWNIPYLGAPPNVRALAEDKHLTKVFARQLGIPTAPWRLYRAGEPPRVPPKFPGPYFVKWRFGASSRDVSARFIVSSWEECRERIEELHAEQKDAIAEVFLPGRSFTVPVIATSIGAQSLPVVETFSTEPGGIVTFEQARGLRGGMRRAICADTHLATRLQAWSCALFEAAGPADYVRVDFKSDALADDLMPNLLEFNVSCNLASKSAMCLSAAEAGLDQRILVSHILAYSSRRQTKGIRQS